MEVTQSPSPNSTALNSKASIFIEFAGGGLRESPPVAVLNQNFIFTAFRRTSAFLAMFVMLPKARTTEFRRDLKVRPAGREPGEHPRRTARSRMASAPIRFLAAKTTSHSPARMR